MTDPWGYDLDEGGEFELTPEEQAALRAALGGGAGETDPRYYVGPGTGGPYAGNAAAAGVNDYTALLNDLWQQYNAAGARIAEIDRQVSSTADPWERDQLSKQRQTLISQRLSLTSRINAMRSKTTATDSYLAPNTSAPFLLRRRPDGSIESIPNPNYRPPAGATRAPRYPEGVALANLQLERERIALEAERKRRSLWDRYQRGEISLEAATSDFDDWYKVQQARLSRAGLAQNAGEFAVKTVLDQMPYMVGPSFGGDFSKALNVLSSGGGPVSFSPDAFTFQLPDLNAIADRAATRALSALSPLPANLGTMGTAPAALPAPIAPAPAPSPVVAALPAYTGPSAPTMAVSGIPPQYQGLSAEQLYQQYGP